MVTVQRETGYTFDTLLSLQTSTTDTATAVSSIIDVGATGSGDNEDGVAIVKGDCVVDASAIDVTTGDESYECVLAGSDSATFASGIEELQTLQLGGATALAVGDVASDAGRYVLPFTNRRNTRAYRYLRLSVVIAGTSPSITWAAYISKSKSTKG